MTKHTGTAHGTTRDAQDESQPRKQRRVTDPDAVFERLEAVASDLDQVGDLARDLDELRQEERALVAQLQDLLTHATQQLQELEAHAQTTEQRSRQMDERVKAAEASYSIATIDIAQQLQRADERLNDALSRSEKAMETWRSADIKRTAEWRTQLEKDIQDQIRTLSTQVRANNAKVEAASAAADQSLSRLTIIEKTYGTGLIDLREALMGERAARQKTEETITAWSHAFHQTTKTHGRRIWRATAIAWVALMLAVAFFVLVSTGTLATVSH